MVSADNVARVGSIAKEIQRGETRSGAHETGE